MGPASAGHGMANRRIAFTWDQPAEGGRQTSGGSNEAAGAAGAGVGPSAGAGERREWDDATKALNELQGMSALQGCPVLAVVSAALQQSSAA